MECAERATSKPLNLINNNSFKTGIPIDLRSSLQYKNFDISHSCCMVAKKRRLLVTVVRVIFPLAPAVVCLI